jgi:hypothetical protein
MIARVSILACLFGASAVLAQDTSTPLFNVFLSPALSVDLSSVYQQIVREATETYRADFPSYASLRVTRNVPSRHLILRMRLSSLVELDLPDSDPFSSIVFTLTGIPDECISPP